MKKVFLYMAMVMAFAACSGDSIGDIDSIIVSNDYLSVPSTSIQLAGDGSKQELTITSNCKWRITSDANWISIDSSTGNGNGTVSITASLNSTGSDRSGTVIVTTDNSKLQKKVRVTQGTPTGAIVPTIDDNHFPEG